MTSVRIEHRPVRNDLTKLLYEEYQIAMKKLSQNNVVRNVARYLTGSIFIGTVLLSVGVLIDRGWICFSK